MAFPVVKARLGEFESFLLSHQDVATLWAVDTNEGFAEVSWPTRCTVDELVTEIELHSEGGDFVYVYNENLDNPDEEWANTDYELVPEVKARDLDDYIVGGSLGKDWLIFACTSEAGSSDRRITLLPAGLEEGDGEAGEDEFFR